MASEETSLDRGAGRLLLAWGLLALVLAFASTLWLTPRAPVEGVGGDAGPEDPVAERAVSTVRGRVQLEVAAELDADAPAQLVDGAASPFELTAPEPGTCSAVAWQAGRKVSPIAACREDGSFELELAPDTQGSVAVEMLVPGHLRALVETSVESSGEVELPPVALGLGFAITGQVVDGRGQGIGGVEVQAMPSPNLDEAEPWRATTDAEGQFAFETLPTGPVDLQAIKPGFALSVVEAVAPESDVLLILNALIDLEGAVVAKADRLEGAKIRLEGSAIWPPVEQSLGTGGEFAFQQLPDGIYGVEVIVPAAEEGAPEFASVPLENVTPDLRVSLALVEAFRIPVRVVDPQGDPVPSARITVGYASISLLQRVAESDLEGRARVGPLVPGPYVVHADATGYLPSEPLEVEVVGDGLAEQTVVLARPGRIEGVVLDEDGRPVADADVLVDAEGVFVAGEDRARARLFDLALGGGTGSLGVTQGKVPDIPKEGEEELGVAGVLTDAEGRFVLDMLMPGTYRLRAIHGMHAGSPLRRVELASGQVVTGVELRLRAGALFTGVVHSENGQPIVGASIELGDGTRLTVDELGAFDAGFHAGEQHIIVRAPGYVPRRIPIRVGQLPVDLQLELETADAALSGVVRDGNGQPIQGALVVVRHTDGLSPTELLETDAKGAFARSGLPPGGVELEVDHLDYVYAYGKARLSAGTTADTTLVMEAGWAIPIHVRARGSGEPLAGVQVRAGKQTNYTNPKGRVTLRKMQGDRVEVQAQALGWTPVSRQIERPEQGVETLEQLFELEEGGAIEGTVTDERGEPVSGALVVIKTPAGLALARTRSRAQGAWRVDGIPEGEVRIEVEPPAALSALLAPLSELGDVRRGEVTRDVQLRFDRL